MPSTTPDPLADMPSLVISGYETSDDYAELWSLAREQSVICIVDYDDEATVRDICYTVFDDEGSLCAENRHWCYALGHTFPEFSVAARSVNLAWLPPQGAYHARAYHARVLEMAIELEVNGIPEPARVLREHLKEQAGEAAFTSEQVAEALENALDDGVLAADNYHLWMGRCLQWHLRQLRADPERVPWSETRGELVDRLLPLQQRAIDLLYADPSTSRDTAEARECLREMDAILREPMEGGDR